ncbi:MAG: magnesium transporter [Bacteroidetes bacterium]|nr:MAG: magnesium transporter [Bacteroidota bacterium]
MINFASQQLKFHTFMSTKKPKKSTGRLGKPGSSKKAGLPPGSLIHIGSIKTENTTIDLISYDAENFEVFTQMNGTDVLQKTLKGRKNWIKVTGLQNTKVIGELADALGLHPLLTEDILNTGQRPKAEIGEGFIFFTMKAISPSEEEGDFTTDQVSFVLREDALITFHERDLPIFDVVYNRMQIPDGRFRSSGLDYLMYALTDIMVDHYFRVMEDMAELIDASEDALMKHSSENTLVETQQIKKDLLLIRKTVFPLREALSTLIKTDSVLINPSQRTYFTDVYDHVMHIYETIENYRDLVSGLKDIYHSSVNLRMSKVMQTLTIISTIFIPLTFIVGVYGMNFDFMPELHFRFGYLAVWVVMLLITIYMIREFRKNNWL